jgi:hypothetical protein
MAEETSGEAPEAEGPAAPRGAKEPRRKLGERLRRGLRASVPYLIITVITLALLDGAMMATGAFPPRYKKGHPTLGFYEFRHQDGGYHRRCPLPECGGKPYKEFWKNEEGFFSSRSMPDFLERPTGKRVVTLGDSHGDLTYAFPYTHMGVLERELRAGGWQGAEVLGAGHGRWSPMQSLTLYEEKLSPPIHPEVVVLNFYTGNDFYDLIRSDDRPNLKHLPDGSYTLAPPLWVAYTDPTSERFWQKSRVLYAGHLLLDAAGIENKYEKLTYAVSSADAYGGSFFDALEYIYHLAQTEDKGLWYSAAIGAQALNQALFFHHFPGSLEESQSRARYILGATAKRLQAAGDRTTLVLAPIPSRMLAKPDYVDPVYDRILTRVPLTKAEVLDMEAKAYESLRASAAAEGWLFVDTLPALREGSNDDYFPSDLHIAPTGWEIGGVDAAMVTRAAAGAAHAAAPRP